MNAPAARRGPRCRLSEPCNPPAILPTSHSRSTEGLRSKSIPPTQMPSVNSQLAGVASPCGRPLRSSHTGLKPIHCSPMAGNSRSVGSPTCPGSRKIADSLPNRWRGCRHARTAVELPDHLCATLTIVVSEDCIRPTTAVCTDAGAFTTHAEAGQAVADEDRVGQT